MNAPPSPSSLAVEWAGLLYDITRQFASTLDIDEALSNVLDMIVRALGANSGSIFLFDQDGYVSKSILARSDLAPEVKRHAIVTVMEQGFTGWVFQNQKSDIIFDTETDGRWVLLPETSIVTRSAMGAPFIRRGKVIGIVIIMHPDPNAFNSRHLLLLEMISTQAAAVIENAAMYAQANNERQMLQAIISGVRDITVVTDLLDRLILANPAAQQVLGLSQALYGTFLNELIVNESDVIEFYHSAVNGGDMEKELTLSNHRIYSCAMVKIPEVGWMIGMHDVTALKQLDETKSEFVSHVSHDLRSPLAVIQGYVWLLDQIPRLNKEARGYVKEIYRLIERMSELINNLLDLSQIEMGIEGDFKDISFTEIVAKAIDGMQAMAEAKGVKLVAELPMDVLSLRGSPLRLSQVVTNLVGNALKFTPVEGTITVRVAAEGNFATAKITDTGPGIPEEMQSQLFHKFTRLAQKATRTNEGYGLGLAIVKTIVDAHKGQVWVQSKEGQGSTFTVTIPMQSSLENPAV
jgi:signal transduction histidine kinase